MEIDLRAFDLFKSCDGEVLKKVLDHIQIRKEGSGVTIFNQGDNPKNLYLILQGSLLVTEYSEEGKTVSHELISKGDCFGEIAIIDQLQRSASVISMENVELGTIGSNFVREILLKDINISNYFLFKFAGIIRKMNKNVFNLITASAKKRLLFQILHLSENKNNTQDKKILDKSLSHSDLASFAGLSRETVSRIITDLKSEGYLSTTKFGEIELDIVKTSQDIFEKMK